VKALRAIRAYLASRVEAFEKAFDIRDVFVFGGLAMLWYGLWSFTHWVGWTATGAVTMALGLGWLFRRPVK